MLWTHRADIYSQTYNSWEKLKSGGKNYVKVYTVYYIGVLDIIPVQYALCLKWKIKINNQSRIEIIFFSVRNRIFFFAIQMFTFFEQWAACEIDSKMFTFFEQWTARAKLIRNVHFYLPEWRAKCSFLSPCC